MEIELSSRFSKSYQKLPERTKIKAKKQIAVFQSDQFDHRLKTHKLVGNNREMWSFSVDYSIRIKFIFLTPSTVLFLDVGGHDIY